MRYFLGLCLWICGVGLLYWVTSTILGSAKVLVPAAVGHLSLVGEAYDLVGDTMIPLEATPMIVTDNRGKSRWTVSIPGTLDFPLRPSDYAKICSQSDAIIDHLLGAKSQSGSRRHGERSHYDHVHSNFMDVVEAEEHGLLSPAMKNKAGGREIVDRLRKEKPVGADQKLSQNGGSICERSLTYVMEGDDAGLGKTLMGLWMSYGLAMEEDRAFFIDDTNWYDRSHLEIVSTDRCTGRMANTRPFSNLHRSLHVCHHHQRTVYRAHIKHATSSSLHPLRLGPLVVLFTKNIKTPQN